MRAIKHARLQELRTLLDQHHDKKAGPPRHYVPTGITELDNRLPHCGLPCGAITELISPKYGSGAGTVAIRAARRASSEQGVVVVVDTHASWYVPALWSLGIRPEQLLLIYPQNINDALWAMEQSLGCSAVASVIASISCLTTAHSRRLQLAAERGNALGIVLRLRNDEHSRSFSAIKMQIEPVHLSKPRSEFDGVIRRYCHVTLHKVREWRPVETFVIGLNNETGTCNLLSVPRHRESTRIAERISA